MAGVVRQEMQASIPALDNFAFAIGPAASAASAAAPTQERGYWAKTLRHAVMGDSAEEDATLASTAIRIAGAFTGADILMDLGDAACCFANWESMPRHVLKTGVYVASVLPGVGLLKYLLKYLDNAVDVGKHSDEAAEVVGQALTRVDVIGDTRIVGQADTVSVFPNTGLVVGRYGTVKDLAIPGQAHHLNQAAAYRGVIPFDEGVSIKLPGNIVTDAGAPHTNAHLSMEGFWNQYRGTRSVPTNLQYTQSLQQSLRASGQLPEAQVQQAVRAAIRERIQYGQLGGMPVPRVPGPIRNIAQ
jgi:hypothetical protein